MPEPLPESPAPPPGKLILVTGPSGSGKDTLIETARRHFETDRNIAFFRRCITRADQSGEAHEFVSDSEFERMEADGAFFASWNAHGLRYGIVDGIHEELAGGFHVIVNFSRSAVAEAREKWPDTHVINITARADILRERLESRGREAADNIDRRLARAPGPTLPDADWVHQLDNSGDVATGAARFIGLITRIVSASAAPGSAA